MGSNVNLTKISFDTSGFSNNRNYELLPDNALISPSTNYNLHNGGIEKRGGSSIPITASVSYSGRGGFNFRQTNGSEYIVYAKSNGSVYHTDDNNVIGSGLSTSNYFNFSQYDDDLYYCDGANVPKKWNGIGLATSVIPATDWATTGQPFQIIPHSQGANRRNWAVTKYGVYASKNNVGDDFADATVKYIPVYSKAGLVAGFEFNGEIFVFSKTQAFRIDDASDDSTTWGYQEAIWEGGAAHFRLICKAGNEVFVMTEDGNIYNIKSIFTSADYEIASLSRPAYIDRYIRENASIADIQEWHCTYDKKLRAIKWFIQVGGSGVNTALVQFIDKPADIAWSIHNNEDYNSGYSASCSFEFRESTGVWKVRTIDQVGNVWQLEEVTRGDNGNPYQSKIKFKPFEFGNPVMWKYFRKGILRVRSDSNVTFTVRIWINGVRKDDVILSISGTGAVFDSAVFDTAVFADDLISFSPFEIKHYGFSLQLELVNNTAGQDYFLSELFLATKEEGVRFDD
jgi:hypothetical protein